MGISFLSIVQYQEESVFPPPFGRRLGADLGMLARVRAGSTVGHPLQEEQPCRGQGVWPSRPGFYPGALG